MRLRRERVVVRDGDFVDLDWLDGPAGAPLVLILHGLEGSARSHYAVGLLGQAQRRGWRGVVLHFRSCSGELNHQARFYHSGETGDLDEVVGLVTEREPTMDIVAVGTSLGGNVLLKWLGERGEATPPSVRGAVGISVPFDLTACARRLDRGLARRLYTANFMRTLRRKVRDKAARFPGFVNVPTALRARTFAEYDRVVTAPLYGFTDERDYWARSSSGPYLGRIRRPTLLINALDDPFIPLETLPDSDTLPACVRAEFSPHGGHAAFIDGRWPWRPDSWAERRALEFAADAIASARAARSLHSAR